MFFRITTEIITSDEALNQNRLTHIFLFTYNKISLYAKAMCSFTVLSLISNNAAVSLFWKVRILCWVFLLTFAYV